MRWGMRGMTAGLLAGLSLGAAAEAPSLTGRWSASGEAYGTRIFMNLELKQTGDAFTGTLDGSKLTGTVKGRHVHFVAEDGEGTDTFDGDYTGGKLTGMVQEAHPNDPDHKTRYALALERVPDFGTGPGKRHDFTPQVFYRGFSPFNAPVLRVGSGDQIHTSTVDAGGVDGDRQKRVLGGNPQTGPFYVEQAMPGDTLAVHIDRLTLNRDYAGSDDAIVPRGLSPDLAVKMKDTGKEVRWHLDRERNVATLEKPGDHTALYQVPLRPMLGCIATAPAPVDGAAPTGDSGNFGGNMDFNQIVEGATVYLPVSVPGALLYLGDGHAAQGDGELNGNALETSMDVEVTVTVIRGHALPGPRVESTGRLIALGYAGSLDDAFRDATANMADWLERQYGLGPSEIAEVIGTAAHYEVAEVADRNAGMALSLDKDRLATLR